MGNRENRSGPQAVLGQLLSPSDSLHLQTHVHRASVHIHSSQSSPSVYYLGFRYDAAVKCLVTVYYLASEALDEHMNTL